MAHWHDTTNVPGKFRGVPFRVGRAELVAGRKTVVHDYPYRDQTFVEDLGKKTREFSIECFVDGPEYIAAKNALLTAIEAPGPGTLEHPYYGTLEVVNTGCHVEESPEKGGVAQFTLQFTPAAAKAFAPGVSNAPAASVAASAESARTLSKNQFAQRFARAQLAGSSTVKVGTVLRGPGFSFTSLAGVIQSASTVMSTGVSPIFKEAQAVADFKRRADALYGDAVSLVRTPFELGTRLGDLFRSLTTLPVTPKLGALAMIKAYRFTPTTARPPATTPTRRAEQVRYDAAVQFVQQSAVVEAAVLAADAALLPVARVTTSTTRQDRTAAATAAAAAAGGFDNYQDAIAVRDVILEQLDEQLAVAGEELYPALDQVRSDLVATVPGDTVQFQRLITYEPAATMPSLVLAYRLYGSVALERDLVSRNRIPHPGFVRGERPLQVLADA